MNSANVEECKIDTKNYSTLSGLTNFQNILSATSFFKHPIFAWLYALNEFIKKNEFIKI